MSVTTVAKTGSHGRAWKSKLLENEWDIERWNIKNKQTKRWSREETGTKQDRTGVSWNLERVLCSYGMRYDERFLPPKCLELVYSFHIQRQTLLWVIIISRLHYCRSFPIRLPSFIFLHFTIKSSHESWNNFLNTNAIPICYMFL